MVREAPPYMGSGLLESGTGRTLHTALERVDEVECCRAAMALRRLAGAMTRWGYLGGSGPPPII